MQRINRASVSAPTNVTGGGKLSGTSGKKPPGIGPQVKIQFKREKVINRERPISGAIFRTFAEEDPECKVCMFVCIYMYLHTFMYICIYIYICIYVNKYVYIYIYIYIGIHVCIYTYI
jgi:hypothetical protein